MAPMRRVRAVGAVRPMREEHRVFHPWWLEQQRGVPVVLGLAERPRQGFGDRHGRPVDPLERGKDRGPQCDER